MSNRPYFHASIEDLERTFLGAQDDVNVLREIDAELGRRNSDRAMRLRNRVRGRFAEVTRERLSEVDEPTHASAEVAEALDQIRKRLLDLSRRNTLLNYRHPAKRCLRIVDELPDQLFSELFSDKAFVFESLPRVPSLDGYVSDKVRAYLEEQTDPRKPPPAGWAWLHGIDPSLELQTTDSFQKRHRDLAIQTLLFPAELETRLRSMAQLARTAIEESGANILYLAFGFLEWREKDESEQTSLAPLLLVPVSLKKQKGLDPATRRERFSLQYSGEDVQANLSLQEKLIRDFSLSLPELEDEDTPDVYIERCRKLLRSQPTWQIRRCVTLGFFQFGKLLMYLDLDPDKSPITSHPLINRLLGGESSEGIGGTESVEIDQIPLDAPEVQLIDQADSSQHAAIIEAVQGRSFVVEGPPGTGKSQTITNIIGVALAEGKSVLFVSEKLAALEVVRSRLEASGLGQFCLELHSHKTQKQKFNADLALRLEQRADTPPADHLKQEIERYRAMRDDIAEYLRVVNKRAPNYDGTYQELFCEAAWLREQLSSFGIHLEPDELAKEPDKETLAAIEANCRAAIPLREAVRKSYGSLNQHPWFGLVPRNADQDPGELISALSNWANSCARVVSGSESLPSEPGVSPLVAYRDLKRTSLVGSHMTSRMLAVANVANVVRSRATVDAFERLRGLEASLAERYRNSQNCWRIENRRPDLLWADVDVLLQQLKFGDADLSKKSPRRLNEIGSCLERINAQVEDASVGISEVSLQIGMNLPSAKQGVSLAQEVLRTAASRPTKSLGHRSAILETLTDVLLLEELCQERERVLQQRAKLSLQFDLSDKLDINKLMAIRIVLENGGFLGMLNSEWRSANEAYQSLRVKRSRFRLARNKIEDLKQLEAYALAEGELVDSQRFKAALGPEFQGTETAAEQLLAIVRWFAEIRDRFGTAPDVSGEIARRIMRLSEESLDRLDELYRSPLSSSLTFLADAVENLQSLAPEFMDYLLVVGWRELPKECGEITQTVLSVIKSLFELIANRDTEASIAEGATVLAAAAQAIQSKNRKELQRLFVNVPREEVWEDDQISICGELLMVLDAIKDEADGSVVRLNLARMSASPELRKHFISIAESVKRCEESMQQVGQVFQIDERKMFGKPMAQCPPSALNNRLTGTAIDPVEAADWTKMASLARALDSLDDGLSQLGSLIFDDEATDEALHLAGRYLALGRISSYLISAEPSLKGFSAEKHEALLDQFRDADRELKSISRLHIAAAASRKRPPEGTSGRRVADLTEMQLIRHEINKQKRHLPIRKVVRRAGRALQALKPCFMMGPLSVAQYLKPGDISFDIAVMDEASQMRPEDALGTIARCKQVIVVGDPNQLPPTSFFDRLASDDADINEDDELVFGAQQSILDVAGPILSRSLSLLWHYRSRHESLIAFSNSNFYNNRLQLFPTAHSSSGHQGLQYHVINGTYANHVNVEEAQALVREVIREVRSGRNRSIGVAAVNIQQTQVIRDEWDRVTRELTDLQDLLYQEDSGLESLFIKNLENVQGDERDVIFVSLTYGRDRNGNFYQRFGPINRDDGWRRLNVLFTRAKEKMHIFSSMSSAMITPTASSKRGVVALRDFLSFCETGIVPEAASASGRGPDSPFEEEVAAAVREFGLRAEYQVGVAGFFIDIGVTHPETPGQYLLGIECDGATYHSGQSVRDRDKIRQEVLENLGWKIHRIWSTDWFKDGARERERLRHALRQAEIEAEAVRSLAVAAAEEEIESGTEVAAEQLNLQVTEDIGLSREDETALRERLLELRVLVREDFPDVPESSCLLHDEIIDALVECRPTTLEEFHQCLPLARRQQIDMDQSRVYLSTVLALVEDVE